MTVGYNAIEYSDYTLRYDVIVCFLYLLQYLYICPTLFFEPFDLKSISNYLFVIFVNCQVLK